MKKLLVAFIMLHQISLSQVWNTVGLGIDSVSAGFVNCFFVVTPAGCGVYGNIKKDQKLHYTIRFLNTGTGNAHNVIIRDAIDTDLDLSTLKIESASDTITNIQIIPDTALIISLADIELEPDSNGFISFSIYPKTSLDDGTTITNQAGIYFDNNEVVLTNVTLNTVYDLPEPQAAFTYKHDLMPPDGSQG